MPRCTVRRSRSSPGCSNEGATWRPTSTCPTASRSTSRSSRGSSSSSSSISSRRIEARRSQPRSVRRSSAELLRIAEELAAEPRVFCHRDYHSRNLMLHDGQLYIIDFQDARMGPDTYDLVSLLRDSYMDFSEREVDELIAFFLALRGVGADRGGARHGSGPVPATVRPDGAAAQSEGARHVRLPDDDARQPGLHPVHPAHAGLRAQQHGARRPVRRVCARSSSAHVEELR